MRRYGTAAAAAAVCVQAAARISQFPLTSSRSHHTSKCGCLGAPSRLVVAPTSSASSSSSSALLFSAAAAAAAGGGGLSVPAPPHFSTTSAAIASCAGVQQRQFSSSSSSNAGSTNNTTNYGSNTNTFADGNRAYVPGQTVQEKFPIVQLPARSLWCKQYALDPRQVRAGEYDHLIAQVKAARHYYQYPSLSAPQTGWNVQMFTLFDDTVFINPVNLDEEEWRAEAARRKVPWVVFEEEKLCELREAGKTGFAWEPCASSGFMLHYIERPLTVRLRALNERGDVVTVQLDRMRGRMALHELDHLQGVLFTRRVVDTDHVVPMEGFVTMSDWSDDYPSLEARSTFLYTIFTPPYHFVTDSVPDGNLLDRKFEDGVYPGCEQDRQQRIESAAAEELQRQAWRSEKTKQQQQQTTQTPEKRSGSEETADVDGMDDGAARVSSPY